MDKEYEKTKAKLLEAAAHNIKAGIKSLNDAGFYIDRFNGKKVKYNSGKSSSK